VPPEELTSRNAGPLTPHRTHNRCPALSVRLAGLPLRGAASPWLSTANRPSGRRAIPEPGDTGRCGAPP